MQQESRVLAAGLQAKLLQVSAENGKGKIIASCMERTREWYAVAIAVSRCNLILLGLQPGSERNGELLERCSKSELGLVCLILEDVGESREPMSFEDHLEEVRLSDLRNGRETSDEVKEAKDLNPEICLCATGGTTSSGKSVKLARCTRSMQAFEVETYGKFFGEMGFQFQMECPRVLQPSSIEWGAAVYGQIDIALALGGTIVMADLQDQVENVKKVVEGVDV